MRVSNINSGFQCTLEDFESSIESQVKLRDAEAGSILLQERLAHQHTEMKGLAIERDQAIHTIEILKAYIQELQEKHANQMEQNEQRAQLFQKQIAEFNHNISQLQQENFSLNGATSNVIGKFPTMEEVTKNYERFGDRLFNFILDVEEDDLSAILPQLLAEIVREVRAHTTNELNRVYEVLYPPPLERLKSSKLAVELTAHLQHNYHTIFTVQEDQFADIFLKWQHVVGFEKGLRELLLALHTLFVQINLTPGLIFKDSTFNTVDFKCPIKKAQPIATLPPLMHHDSVVVKGFAC